MDQEMGQIASDLAALDSFIDPEILKMGPDLIAQFMRKDQMAKFVKYGIRPSFYTLHTYYFYEAHLKNRGKAQAQYLSPMRDAIDAGMKPTNHTDFVVAPLDQMMMLWSAVNRISRWV
jgi:predicted amidohydrolase YtcJ